MRVEIEPFTCVVWKDREARERYQPVLSWFDEKRHKVELLMIKKGLRRCDVEHIYPHIMQEQLVQLHKAGLKFKPLEIVRRYQGFAHRHERATSLGDAMIFGVVGERVEDLDRFAEAYYRGDHYTQGELLGYPECCRKFFVDAWSAGEYDPIYLIAANTGIGRNHVVKGDPLLNVMVRYVGLRLIFFFPCSFRCENAREFALHVLDLMKKEDKGMLRTALEILSMPVTWSQVNGIIEVDVGDIFKIIAGGYTGEKQFIRFEPLYDPRGLV